MSSPPKIHIVSPLISKGFRDLEAIKTLVGPSCSISLHHLERGPASVESAVDEMLAAPGVVNAAIMAEAQGADAIVIDCMLDPGLEAAREAVSIPVIGAGEAGLQAAAAFGVFSVVTVLQRQDRLFQALARRLGLSENMASVRGIGVPVLALTQDRTDAVARTIDQGRDAQREDKAKAIVFGCTGMLGFAPAVASALGWSDARVIDPLPNAILAAIEATKHPAPRYPAPERKEVLGFDGWPALHKTLLPETCQ